MDYTYRVGADIEVMMQQRDRINTLLPSHAHRIAAPTPLAARGPRRQLHAGVGAHVAVAGVEELALAARDDALQLH